jgi:hypothetical protein
MIKISCPEMRSLSRAITIYFGMKYRVANPVSEKSLIAG